MSTIISSAYDRLRVTIAANLPDHRELSNPYYIEKDADLLFDKAWAVAFGNGFNTNRQISCSLTVERDFIFVVTRKLFIKSHRDVDVRANTEKLLFEDQFTVIKALENDPFLNSSASGIAKCVWSSDGGLEFVRSDRTDLIMIQTVMNLEYFESLT